MQLNTRSQYYEHQNFSLSKPELVGYYSLNSEREYKDDYSEMKFIRHDRMLQRQLNLDLNHNMDNRKKRLKGHEKLSRFLQYFKSHRKILDVSSKSFITMDDVPFVCHRGTLRAISKLPYEYSEPFRLSICLANGVIYIHILETPETRKKEDMTEREQIMCAWGYKFEQYVVSDSPCSEPDPSSPVDENSEFNCVFTSTLGKHKLIYGAEMDGFLVDQKSEKFFNDLTNHTDFKNHESIIQHLKNQKRIELKTSRVMEEDKHYYTFRKYKSLQWWLQSYFADIDCVVCGFRNDNGIVSEILPYKTHQLPSHAQGWSDRVCLNFCHDFLLFVKQVLTAEIKQRGYSGGRDVNIRTLPMITLVLHRKLKSPVIVDTPWPEEDISILEDWFIEMIK